MTINLTENLKFSVRFEGAGDPVWILGHLERINKESLSSEELEKIKINIEPMFDIEIEKEKNKESILETKRQEKEKERLEADKELRNSLNELLKDL